MYIISLQSGKDYGKITLVSCHRRTNAHHQWTRDPEIHGKRGVSLHQDTKYFIVEGSALPEIFLKVLEVERLLALEKEYTVQSASKKVGISRSAYYKYKDLIRPFHDIQHGGVVTIQLIVADSPGVLSEVLAVFALWKVNILTINQNIPSDHSAVVTISAETSETTLVMEDFLRTLTQVTGVIKGQLLAG